MLEGFFKKRNVAERSLTPEQERMVAVFKSINFSKLDDVWVGLMNLKQQGVREVKDSGGISHSMDSLIDIAKNAKARMGGMVQQGGVLPEGAWQEITSQFPNVLNLRSIVTRLLMPPQKPYNPKDFQAKVFTKEEVAALRRQIEEKSKTE